jgi:hypothetical protein
MWGARRAKKFPAAWLIRGAAVNASAGVPPPRRGSQSIAEGRPSGGAAGSDL